MVLSDSSSYVCSLFLGFQRPKREMNEHMVIWFLLVLISVSLLLYNPRPSVYGMVPLTVNRSSLFTSALVSPPHNFYPTVCLEFSTPIQYIHNTMQHSLLCDSFVFMYLPHMLVSHLLSGESKIPLHICFLFVHAVMCLWMLSWWTELSCLSLYWILNLCLQWFRIYM